MQTRAGAATTMVNNKARSAGGKDSGAEGGRGARRMRGDEDSRRKGPGGRESPAGAWSDVDAMLWSAEPGKKRTWRARGSTGYCATRPLPPS